MADAKISALTALASGHATGDLIPIADVSDTTQAASGTTKKTTLANLLANLPGPTDAVGISFTGQSLTGSNASTMLNLAGTWNTSGTPTAVKLNVTDTASNAASLLMDLQVGGVSQASIGKTGTLTLNGVSSVAAQIVSTAQFRTGGIQIGGNYAGGSALAVFDSAFGTGYFAAGSSGAIVSGSRYIGFATTLGSAADTGFTRNAAGVINVTNASTGIRGLLGGGASVASASALPLPTGRVFHVTGTTTITSITSTNFQAGVVITLIFDAALTVTDGSNLKLAGDFVTTADDTLTLCYDGTNWFEVCRSVN